MKTKQTNKNNPRGEDHNVLKNSTESFNSACIMGCKNSSTHTNQSIVYRALTD
jgi:hypothetical protein